jgi:hypothetical protein
MSPRHTPRIICACSRHRLLRVSSIRRGLFCGQVHTLPKPMPAAPAANAIRPVCSPTDGNSRPILNGDLRTSPFYGQHSAGNCPACRMFRCWPLAALIARIAIAYLPLRSCLPSQLRALEWCRIRLLDFRSGSKPVFRPRLFHVRLAPGNGLDSAIARLRRCASIGKDLRRAVRCNACTFE